MFTFMTVLLKVGYNSTDLGVTCMAYTAERASFVDYTTPLLERTLALTTAVG